MISPQRKLSPNEGNSFVFAYFDAVTNPWWHSAMQQHYAGDDKLMNEIKKKAMRETCKNFGIAPEYGMQLVNEFIADLQPPKPVDEESS